MTIYCEGAQAAEITFSLTGGREGRIISLSPPVEVDFLTEESRHLVFFFVPGWETPFWNEKFKIGEIIAEMPIGSIFREKNYYDRTNNKTIFNYIRRVENQYSEVLEEDKILFHYEDNIGIETGIFYYDIIKGGKNFLKISDLHGILFYQQMPNIPTWKVKCIKCPPGLCGIRAGYGRIACLDCKKVLNGLGEINNKLDIYGR